MNDNTPTLAVGSPLVIGANGHEGRVYVYLYNGTDWVPDGDAISIPVPPGNEQFGNSVALSGNTLVVTTVQTGTVAVFRRDDPPADPHHWTLTSSVLGLVSPNNANPNSHNIATDRGAVAVTTTSGAVQVYDSFPIPSGSPINDPTGSGSSFATALSLSGRTLAIGATGSNSVYVYNREPGCQEWTLESTLSPDSQYADKQFGWSVAIDGDVLVVGARGVDTQNPANSVPGAAYRFIRAGGTWFEDPVAGRQSPGSIEDWAGYSVGVSAGLGIIGVPAKFYNNATVPPGRAFIFGSLVQGSPSAGSNDSWKLTGNAINQSTDFLGTTDGKSLVIKTKLNPNSGLPEESVRIDGEGLVGIGTGSQTPRAPLDVFCDFGKPAIVFGRGPKDYHSISTYFDGDHPEDNWLGFNVHRTNGDGDPPRVMTVRGDGRVGIGTTTPLAPLDIFSDFGNDALVFDRGARDYHSISTWFDGTHPDGNWLGFNIHRTDDEGIPQRVMTVRGDGRVGIGTTDPAATLDVNGTARIGNNPSLWAGGGDENLHIIRGTVTVKWSGDNYSVPPQSGPGWTLSTTWTGHQRGEFRISFTNAFADNPSATITVLDDHSVTSPLDSAIIHSIDANLMEVWTVDHSQAKKSARSFCFIVMGPR